MITKEDLYDITFSLMIIRYRISDQKNLNVLYQIIKVLEAANATNLQQSDDEWIEDNQIRKAISTVDDLDQEFWSFAFHNNVYVNQQILKNPYIYDLLIKILRELLYVIKNEEFKKAFDLADNVHCLPELIADNNFTVPTRFWKYFVKNYRKKWDKKFLRKEQKMQKKYKKKYR